MSPGSGSRQTGTIPKTKVRNNSNVPQEAVTPTRRDINLGNLVNSSLDLVPGPDYGQTQNRSRRTIDEDSNPDFGDVSLVHEGGRFVPVRPQPRTPVAKAPVAHRECPVFSRYRDSMSASDQMDETFGSPNAYFSNQTSRQNNAAAVMIVNPTTANSSNQQIQQNTENYQNANSIIVRNNSIGRTNFPPGRSLPSARPRSNQRALPNNNTVTIGPSISNAPKSSNIIHNGFNPAAGQSNIQPSNGIDNNQDHRMSQAAPHNVEFELGQIRGYIRATSNLVHDLRAVENEDEDQEKLLQELLNKLNKMKDNENKLEMMLLHSPRNESRVESSDVSQSGRDDAVEIVEISSGAIENANSSTQLENISKNALENDQRELIEQDEEEARPSSSQSNCSGYSENELYQNELRVKLEKSQQRIQALQDQKKQLMMCQQQAKMQLAKVNAAMANRSSQDNEACQLDYAGVANGMINDSAENAQNYRQVNASGSTRHEAMCASTPKRIPQFSNQQLRDFNQRLNSIQSERFNRNSHQAGRRGSSQHRENYAEACQPFRVASERTSGAGAAAEETMDLQSLDRASDSDGEGDDESMPRQHSVDLQHTLMELQAKTAHIENMFVNLRKVQLACRSDAPLSGETQRKSRRSNSLSLSPDAAGNDTPQDYTFTQENVDQSHSSDEDSGQEGAVNDIDLTSNQAAQINEMEMKLEKLKGMMHTVSSIENRLATSVLDDPAYNSSLQQTSNSDTTHIRSSIGSSANSITVENGIECNSRTLHYEDMNPTKHHNYNINLGSRRFNDSNTSNKCRNSGERNMSNHEKIGTTMTAMNEFMASEERQRLHSSGARSSRYSDPHLSDVASLDRKASQDERKRRLHSLISREFDHSNEESPENVGSRQSDAQSQVSRQSGRSSMSNASLSLTMPGCRMDVTHNALSCACQSHHGFACERDEGGGSAVSMVRRKNNKNSSNSSASTARDRQDRTARCLHTAASTPDQCKEESTYCNSGHSLDTSAINPNQPSSMDGSTYRVTHPHSKQHQRHLCKSGVEENMSVGESMSAAASQGSLGSLPTAPPPLSPLHMHNSQRWQHTYPTRGHASLPTKESSISGGETTTSMGPTNEIHRSWWQQNTEQLQQQLEQTRNLCQTLLQDGRFQPRHSEAPQSLEHIPPNLSCPPPANFPGTFMMPYGVVLPMGSDVGMSTGAGSAAPNNWWALAGCYQQLNSQQWEISTLRNSLIMLEEKYLSLLNLVNTRAQSTPPSGVPDDSNRQHSMRTRSALSNGPAHRWQNPPSANPVDRYSAELERPVVPVATVQQRNVAQDYPQHCHVALDRTQSWASHDARSHQHDSAPSKSSQPTQHNVIEYTNADIQHSNYRLPTAPNPNILNCLEPQLVQNNTNPNCLLSLTTHAQSALPQAAPLAPSAPSVETHPTSTQIAAVGQNTALNNQVPPGNRANNYWDNFRSYSRQNLLSGSSKTNADSLMGAFASHNPQPLTERSHNTLHSSSSNNMSHNTPMNTPKRNINSASANASNLSQAQSGTETVRNRGRRNIAQDSSSFAAPPDVLNVNQNSDVSIEADLNSIAAVPDDPNRFNFNINREYDVLQDRNINVVNPIPEILVSHTNNFNKRKSSSKLPAKNVSSAAHRNIDLSGGGEAPNLNLANASAPKIFDSLKENVYTEVSALISANQAHPLFLIQLFRDLQLISSDPLRQRMLASIREVSHDVDTQSQNMAWPSAPPVTECVTSSTETKRSSNIDRHILDFIFAHKGVCSLEFLNALTSLIYTLQPSDRTPPDFAEKIKQCLLPYENVEACESMIDDISSLIDAHKENESDENTADGVVDESALQDVAGSLERILPEVPSESSLPSCFQRADVEEPRSSSDSSNSQRLSEPKIDLIESAEVCNGDLAEADQSRHNESSADLSGAAASAQVVLGNPDGLPDVVDTEEQTPTEAEAEWLGLERSPRAHGGNPPDNQTESSQG